MKSGFVLAVAVVALAAPITADAQWSDNFDSYATGSGLIGQGGWEGWDGDPSFDATVSDAFALSAPNSVCVEPITDVVQLFSGVDSGAWLVTAYQYIPSGHTGATYFIMLNTYPGVFNWSTQLRFENGLMINDFSGTSLPITFDQWVELSVEIDFVANTQTIVYGGTLLEVVSWTEGASGGGELNLAAIDLFSAGASPVYYDDLSVMEIGGTPIESTSWSRLKESYR